MELARFTFIALNVLLSIAGLAVVGSGGYCIAYLWNLEESLQKLNDFELKINTKVYYLSSAFAINVGCCLVVLFTGGAIGAWTRNRCTLKKYWMVALPLATATLIFTIIGFMYYVGPILDTLQNLKMIRGYLAVDEKVKSITTTLELLVECCGVSGHYEYLGMVPTTCCPRSVWDRLIAESYQYCPSRIAFQRGCRSVALDLANEIITILGSVLTATIIFQYLTAFLAIYLSQKKNIARDVQTRLHINERSLI
ncbi:jg23554 [Pararge aegeria aegeria]|uniref:Jg23554 protein n=1 Tax=Pararge aegeria aegeria TaxID=348720 RepID=A0A8S4S747_9NEOP|nr:jg23554 [Pararge aegeria aegeria]